MRGIREREWGLLYVTNKEIQRHRRSSEGDKREDENSEKRSIREVDKSFK